MAGRKRKYDWDKIFSTPVAVMKSGRDYDCPNSTIGSQIRIAASQRGLSIHLEEYPDGSGFRIEVRDKGESNSIR